MGQRIRRVFRRDDDGPYFPFADRKWRMTLLWDGIPMAEELFAAIADLGRHSARGPSSVEEPRDADQEHAAVDAPVRIASMVSDSVKLTTDPLHVMELPSQWRMAARYQRYDAI